MHQMFFPNLTHTYYYLFVPVSTFPHPIPHQKPHPNISTPPNHSQPYSEESLPQIVLNRQDLQKYGYDQKKKVWNEQEDTLLMSLCEREDLIFEQIAKRIEGRNAKMCYSRYRRLMSNNQKYWSSNQEQKLLSLVFQHGTNNWKTIASNFKNRNHRQLKEHYENYLRSDLDRSPWTIEQDLELIRLLNVYGKNWKKIEELMNGRSQIQIKNRYFGRIRRLNSKKMQSFRLKPENSHDVSCGEQK